MPASPLVLVSDNGGPFNSPSPPDNYGLDINPGDPVSLILQFPSGVANWYLQIGLVQIVVGVPILIPGTGADEITAPSLPSLSGVNPSTGLVSSPTATVTFTFPPAGTALLFSSTVTGTFGVVTTTFVLFARTIEGYRVGPAGMTREGSGAAGWVAIVNPAIRAINTIWGVEIAHLVNGFLYYNGSTLTWNVLGGDVTPGSTSGGTQLLEVTGIRNEAVPTLTSGYLQWNGSAFVWSNPPGSVPSGTGLWYASSSTLHGNAITLTGDVSQEALSGNNVPIEVTGIRTVSIPVLSDGFLYYNGDNFLWTILGGDITPGVTAGGTQSLEVTGLLSTALPSLTSGYLHYNGTAFVWDNPGGGSGITELVGGVIAGPGTGTVTANTVELTKTVDCTNAGVSLAPVSITAFDGMHLTVTGLGAVGSLALGYHDISQTDSAYLYGPALSGTGALITAGPVSSLMTITGLTGMYADIVGKTMVFTGFSNSVNNGSFVIETFISSTSVQIQNASGISPDSGGSWNVSAGALNGLTLEMTVDGVLLSTVLVVSNNEGLFEIQTSSPTSLTTGDTVTIVANGFSYINGSWTVTVIDSTHFTLNDSAAHGVFFGTATVSTGPTTLTFDTATSAFSMTAMFAAIEATWPTLTATLGGEYGTGLTLTGTTLGSAGSILIGNGSSQSYLSVYLSHNGYPGINVGGQSPTALTLGGFSNATNNGTFNVSSWINSTTVTVYNPAGVAPDTGTGAYVQGDYNAATGTLYGPLLTGSTPVVASFLGELATITGLTGMTVSSPGQNITFAGFTNNVNNGTFPIAGFVSATSVTIVNPSAIAPDTGSSWSVPAGTLNTQPLILTVNGVGPTTLTFDTATNANTSADVLAAIEATWPSLAASIVPSNGYGVLKLVDSTTGPSSTLTVNTSIYAYVAVTVTSFTTPFATLTGLTEMTPGVVGASIYIQGFANGGNTGTFTITSYISPTSVVINNPSAVAPDTGNFWEITGYAYQTFGLYSPENGNNGNATFAVSLDEGSPPVSGAGILALSGTTFGPVVLCYQGTGPFRCQVENNTVQSVYFQNGSDAQSPAFLNGTSVQSVSSDGTVVNYDTPAPPTPPAYVVTAYNGGIGGTNIAYVNPYPNTPFTFTLSGTPNVPIGSVNVEESSAPFYGLIVNESTNPVTVTNNNQFTLPFPIRPGEAELVLTDGNTGIWSVPTTSGDNGRTARASRYLLQRANTVGAPYLTEAPPDLLWGANQGDGSIGPLTQDILVSATQISPSGSDIAILGNILYCGGSVALIGLYGTGYTITETDGVYFVSGLTDITTSLVGQKIYLSSYGEVPIASVVNATEITLNTKGSGTPTPGYYPGNSWEVFSTSPGNLGAYSLGTGQLLSWANLGEDGLSPNTVVGFKMAPEDLDEGNYFVNDGIFVVDDSSAYVLGLGNNQGFFGLVQFPGYSSSWVGARGIMILGNDASSSLPGGDGGYSYYGTVSVWTDPTGDHLWVADFINNRFPTSSTYLGNTPHAICLDPATERFWVVQEGIEQVVLLSLNLEYTGSAPTLNTISSFNWPQQVNNYGGKFDDILFDGTYLWAIDRLNSTYYQLTPNGFVVSVYTLSTDDYQTLDMSNDSRLYFDGTYVWITGLVVNELGSAVVSIHPGTGLPVEYYPFSALATRGMAFDKGSSYVYTFGTILEGDGYHDTSGTIYTAVGTNAQFNDPYATWSVADVGNYIRITGAYLPDNNGVFQISGFLDANNIYIANPYANGLPPDPMDQELNNGGLSWQEYGSTGTLARLTWEPPGTDYGTLDSILTCPGQVTGWGQTARLGARVIEYANYSSATTFSLFQQNISIPPLPGTRVLFVDRDGNAGEWPLTLRGDFQSISGQAQYVLNTPFGFVELEWDGGTWLVIRTTGGAGLPVASPVAPCTYNADANSLQSFQTTSGIPTVTFNFPCPGTEGSAISSLTTPALITIDFSIRLQDTTSDNAAWWKFSWAVSVQTVGSVYNQLGPALNTFVIGTAGGGIPPTGWGVVVQFDGTNQYIQAAITGDPSNTCNGSIEAEWNLLQ